MLMTLWYNNWSPCFLSLPVSSKTLGISGVRRVHSVSQWDDWCLGSPRASGWELVGEKDHGMIRVKTSKLTHQFSTSPMVSDVINHEQCNEGSIKTQKDRYRWAFRQLNMFLECSKSRWYEAVSLSSTMSYTSPSPPVHLYPCFILYNEWVNVSKASPWVLWAVQTIIHTQEGVTGNLTYSPSVRSPDHNLCLQLAPEVGSSFVGFICQPVGSDTIFRYIVSEMSWTGRHIVSVH